MKLKKNKNKNKPIKAANNISNDTAMSDTAISTTNDVANNMSNKTEFVNNLYQDEMRCGFLVKSDRKKLWNVEIGLINEFARICKKYNLHWFAMFGTLLGAVRHKGFIPWDDDVDVAMLRPDFEKFKQVAATEIKYPYFLDCWFNYRRESDELAGIKSDEPNLPLISMQYEKTWLLGTCLIKLKDSRTTFIEPPNTDRLDMNQGVFIDIFPLDSVQPFKDKQQDINNEIRSELLWAALYPESIKKAMAENKKLLLSYEELKKIVNMPFKQRGLLYENYMLQTFSFTGNIGRFISPPINKAMDENAILTYESEKLKNFIRLPFENTEVIAPADYDYFLKCSFGDWHKLIISHTHAQEYSTDIPYNDYLKLRAKVVNK